MMHCPWFAAPWQIGAIEMQATFGGHAAMFGDDAGLFCRILCFLFQPRGAGAGSRGAAGWGALVHTPGEDAPGGAGGDAAVFGVLSLF